MITKKQLGQKIKKLRKDGDWSQEELAKSLGISRAALSELERGIRGLSALELAEAAKFFGLSADILLEEVRKPGQSAQQRHKRVNGHIKFEPKKLEQLILYILNKCGGKPNVGETVLYKLLYFVDFNTYEILGKPVTGLNYVHQQFGPMPQNNQYLELLEKMKKEKRVRIFNQEYFGKSQKRYMALADYNVETFSSHEKEIIDKVINQLSDMNARQIEDYAHGDVPWQVTKDNDIISYDLVIDRVAPYAYRDYEQAWQDAAGSDCLDDLGEMSEEEYNYYKNL